MLLCFFFLSLFEGLEGGVGMGKGKGKELMR